MRLALVSDWYPPRVGGIETHVRALAVQLAAAGHAVDVITTAAGSPDGQAAARPGRAGGPRSNGASGSVRVRRLALACLPRVAVAVMPRRTFEAVAAALADGGYDLVHAHASVLSPLAFAAAAAGGRLGIPTVVTHHSVLGGTVGIFAAADRVIGWTGWPVLHTAVSPLVAGELGAAAARRGVRLPVRVLPNGIHPEVWAASPGGRRDREAADVREFRVASVMRLARRKRPDALVAVAARVRAALPPGVRFTLRVAGDGPERRGLERSVARHGLGDVVELLGWRPPAEVRELFAASDAFVLPSILESFGLAALEARCAGLPVVAMRRAGPAGFVRDGVEGLLADDDAGLAAALVRLALDDRLRAGIARHNRTTRPAETWDRVLDRHAAVYAEARQVAYGALPRSSARPDRAAFAGPAA